MSYGTQGYQALTSVVMENGSIGVQASVNDPEGSLRVKAIVLGRFKHFIVPVNCKLSQLIDKINIANKTEQYNISTAYMLWLFFGWLGIHRFYLKQHSALTWLVWTFTGQLFGIGWLFDGFTMPVRVRKLNSAVPIKSQSVLFQFAFGKRDECEPNMIVAYLLWFFFGFFGIHRWYTGYHTPSSFIAWAFTGQMFVAGWFYDLYYTQHMVRHPKDQEYGTIHLKYHDGDRDYMPIENEAMLGQAIRAACARDDRTLRILAIEKRQDSHAYLSWFFGGLCGIHASYMSSHYPFVRLITLNYLFFGCVAHGINLQDMIHESNEEMHDDFIPSEDGRGIWPRAHNHAGIGAKEALEAGKAAVDLAMKIAGKK